MGEVPKETGLLESQSIYAGHFMLDKGQEMWMALNSPPSCAVTTLSCVLGGGTLRTCVLRPPGIYGPEEQRHLPRVAVGPLPAFLGPEAERVRLMWCAH